MSDDRDVPTVAPQLLTVFRSRLQGELLALVLVDPDRPWTIDELAQRMGEPYQTVAAEVRRLQQADLITVSVIGRTKHLSANTANPYIQPLTQLAIMAFGPPLVIHEEYSGVAGIDEMYIYGSWAARYRGESGPTPHDIDLLIIGTPDRDEVYDAAQRAQRRLGRQVNPTLRTQAQWDTATDGFSTQLRSSPMIQIS